MSFPNFCHIPSVRDPRHSLPLPCVFDPCQGQPLTAQHLSPQANMRQLISQKQAGFVNCSTNTCGRLGDEAGRSLPRRMHAKKWCKKVAHQSWAFTPQAHGAKKWRIRAGRSHCQKDAQEFSIFWKFQRKLMYFPLTFT